MSRVYSHICEEERQVIQIEVGNGTTVRRIAAMLGRSPSSVSREIKRNTWFPSNRNESYRPYRPARLKTGPWTGLCYVAGLAQRRADPWCRHAIRPGRPVGPPLPDRPGEHLAVPVHGHEPVRVHQLDVTHRRPAARPHRRNGKGLHPPVRPGGDEPVVQRCPQDPADRPDPEPVAMTVDGRDHQRRVGPGLEAKSRRRGKDLVGAPQLRHFPA